MEILEVKNTVTNIEKHRKIPEAWMGQRKESLNWKIESQKFSNMKNWGLGAGRNRAKGTCGTNNKKSNVYTTIISEGEENNRVEKVLGEIIAEHSPNLVKGINLQIQEAKLKPNRINPK